MFFAFKDSSVSPAMLASGIVWIPVGRIGAADSFLRRFFSPKTAEKAVAGQDDIGWPFGMLREYSLLGVDAVHKRHPTD